MHLGFDLLFLDPGHSGGRETYARELLRALRIVRPDLRVTTFVNGVTQGKGFWTEEADRTVVLRRASPRSSVRWAYGEAVALPRAAARAGVEVLHSPANFAPLGGPFARVVTVHDLIFRRLPESVRRPQRWGTEALVPAAARRAHRVITVSAASRDDIVAEIGVDPARIDVIHNGITPPGPGTGDAAAGRARLDAGERRVALSVASAVAHKNLGALLDGLAAVSPTERPLLAFAGHGTDVGELPAHVRALGLRDDVRLLGAVESTDLEDLYAATDLLITTTRYEGFGLPILEAMARGIPVACSDIPVLREVAGDTAIWLNPTDPTSIAHALTTQPPATANLNRAHDRATTFTWHRAARATAVSYDRALGLSPKRPAFASR